MLSQRLSTAIGSRLVGMILKPGTALIHAQRIGRNRNHQCLIQLTNKSYSKVERNRRDV
jgi:hypothetical protein